MRKQSAPWKSNPKPATNLGTSQAQKTTAHPFQGFFAILNSPSDSQPSGPVPVKVPVMRV